MEPGFVSEGLEDWKSWEKGIKNRVIIGWRERQIQQRETDKKTKAGRKTERQ